MEKAAREEKKKYKRIKIEIHKARNEKEVWGNQEHQGPHPNQQLIETKVPAIQAEQVEDDVAPVTAEYVPAKTRDEEYG